MSARSKQTATEAVDVQQEGPQRDPYTVDMFEGDGQPGDFALELAVIETPETRPQLYNADTKQWVTSTPERRAQASFLLKHIQAATLVQAVAVKRFHDEGLYVDLGYNTWKEFCETELEMSDSYTRKLRAIADRFAGLLPDGWSGEQKLISSGDLPANAVEIGGLGLRKLYELTKLPEEETARLQSTGVVRMADGSERTLEEIKSWTVREMSEQFREQKKALTERLQVTEQEKKLVEAKLDVLSRRQEVAQQQYETGKALERLYGPRAAQLEEKARCLNEARAHFNRFAETLKQSNVAADDPETLRNDLFLLFSHVDDLVERLKDHYREPIEAELAQY